MTPEEFFYQVFEFLPRQGPGCTGASKKAYSYLPPLPRNAKILDIGCGSGTQTMDLAGLTSGMITAVDNHQPFIDAITARAQKDGMAGRISAVCASMDTLPFEPGQFDLIWSEGAIFIMGFVQGLRAWKPLFSNGIPHPADCAPAGSAKATPSKAAFSGCSAPAAVIRSIFCGLN